MWSLITCHEFLPLRHISIVLWVLSSKNTALISFLIIQKPLLAMNQCNLFRIMSFKLVSPYNPTFQALRLPWVPEIPRALSHFCFHSGWYSLCLEYFSCFKSFKILFILYDLAQMPQHLPIQLTCKDLQCARRWEYKARKWIVGIFIQGNTPVQMLTMNELELHNTVKDSCQRIYTFLTVKTMQNSTVHVI